MNSAPELSLEEIAQPHIDILLNKISSLEGDESIISVVQQEIIDCINNIRISLGKDPLDLGALEVAHLMIGEQPQVFEPEFEMVIGTLEPKEKGQNQVFNVTDIEALKNSILVKVNK